MGTTADKLKNIRKAKKDLADKFYINEITPLADYADLISNEETVEIGMVGADMNFQPMSSTETVFVDNFYCFGYADSVSVDKPAKTVDKTIQLAKVQNILDAKNAVKAKFEIDDTVPLAQYAETIPTNDTAILGYIDQEKNFQDLLFYDKTGVPKNEAISVDFYKFSQSLDVEPLTFTCRECRDSSSKIKLSGTIDSSATEIMYRTSVDSEWLPYAVGTELILAAGDYVQFRNNKMYMNLGDSGTSLKFETFGYHGYNASYENDSYYAKFDVSGNIMSMLYNGHGAISWGCFQELFMGCACIVDASGLKLPATTLDYACYRRMFYGCSALEKLPELPATTMARSCYSEMFSGCKNNVLDGSFKLPATTLAEDCYRGMFSNYGNYKGEVPALELPATTLAESCYYGMFASSSIVDASGIKLPATSLAENCYYGMFESCNVLVTAPDLPATTLAKGCYWNMFANCADLNPAPELPATTLAESCYNGMFYYCNDLRTAPELPATTLAKKCYTNMFAGCHGLETAPDLPATTLVEGCYNGMFAYCGDIKEFRVHFTEWLYTETEYGETATATAGWVTNISGSDITFYKSSALPDTDPHLYPFYSGFPSGCKIVNL